MAATPLLRRYINSDFIQFMKDVEKTARENNTTELHLDAPLADLDTVLSPLDRLFMKEHGSQNTDALTLLDSRRDAAIVGIRTVAEAYINHFDPVMQQAATTLLAGIDKYGSEISKRSLTSETGIIDNLVKDIQQQQPLTAAVNTLGLYAWVNELQAANTAFNDLYLGRNTEYAGRPQENFSGMRAAVTDKYHKLTAQLSAYATLNPQEPRYTVIMNKISSLAVQYNAHIRKRSSKPAAPAA